MLYLLAYLCLGMVVMLFVSSRNKHKDDQDGLVLFLCEPLGLMVLFFFWPVVVLAMIANQKIRREEADRVAREHQAKIQQEQKITGKRKKLIGAKARALSALRPQGLVEINHQRIQAVSDDGIIQPGEHLIVTHECNGVFHVSKRSVTHKYSSA